MTSINKTITALTQVCLLVFLIASSVHLTPLPNEQAPWLTHNSYNTELQSSIYQGDILLPEHMSTQGKNALKIEAYKWPKGTIPYIFHEKYPEDERVKVLKAMARFENETCIKFVPLKTRVYNTYIEIGSTQKGCYAMIGYHTQKNGQGLPVNFQLPECTRHQGTIEHELLHVIGILHEQARSDRDKYVKIIWDNIEKAYWSDFGKASEREVTAHGVPYDYQSVMHYPANAFSKNGKDTIVSKKDPKAVLGQRVGATKGDLEKVRKMYCKASTSEENGFDEVEDSKLLDAIIEYVESDENNV